MNGVLLSLSLWCFVIVVGQADVLEPCSSNIRFDGVAIATREPEGSCFSHGPLTEIGQDEVLTAAVACWWHHEVGGRCQRTGTPEFSAGQSLPHGGLGQAVSCRHNSVRGVKGGCWADESKERSARGGVSRAGKEQRLPCVPAPVAHLRSAGWPLALPSFPRPSPHGPSAAGAPPGRGLSGLPGVQPHQLERGPALRGHSRCRFERPPSCEAAAPRRAPTHLGCVSQVRQRLPEPQHGGETAGAGLAGLQEVAGQGGEVRGEGEDGARAGQTPPGTKRRERWGWTPSSGAVAARPRCRDTPSRPQHSPCPKSGRRGRPQSPDRGVLLRRPEKSCGLCGTTSRPRTSSSWMRCRGSTTVGLTTSSPALRR